MSDSGEYRDPPVAVDSIASAALKRRLDAGDPVRLLDVRNRDEHEAWHIDAAETTVIPYMKWLQADVTDSVPDLAADIEGEGPITVVCARGEASAYVAGLLTDAGIEARNLDAGMEGWARLDDAVESDVDADGATVLQYQRPSSGCLSYMLVSGGEAAVVDPLGAFTDRYVADANEHDATITLVVDTHVHADHVSGLRDLAAETGATAVMPRMAVERGVTYDVETVIDGAELAVGDATLRAVHAPGHTTGSTAFAVGDLLLTGDSLFVESIARPDLEQGHEGAEPLANQLYATLTDRFGAFGADTLVAPGHYGETASPGADGSYTARLGDLRESLPVFDMERTAFVARILRDMPPRPDNFEEIIHVNMGRSEADEEAAFELELGPNNCAAGPL